MLFLQTYLHIERNQTSLLCILNIIKVSNGLKITYSAPFDSTKVQRYGVQNVNLTVFQGNFLSFLVRNVSRNCNVCLLSLFELIPGFPVQNFSKTVTSTFFLRLCAEREYANQKVQLLIIKNVLQSLCQVTNWAKPTLRRLKEGSQQGVGSAVIISDPL